MHRNEVGSLSSAERLVGFEPEPSDFDCKAITHETTLSFANQWTCLYMIGSSVMKELNHLLRFLNTSDTPRSTTNKIFFSIESSSAMPVKVYFPDILW